MNRFEWKAAVTQALDRALAATARVAAAKETVAAAEAEFAAAMAEHNALLDAAPPGADESGSKVDAAPSLPRQFHLPKGAAVPGTVDVSAVPPRTAGYSARVAVLMFFAAQKAPVRQEVAVSLFRKAGYTEATARQAMYDLTSSKHGTLSRSPAGLEINARGLAFLGQS